MTNPMKVWYEKEKNKADFWKEKALNMVEKSTYLELEKFLLDEQSRFFERIRVLEGIIEEKDEQIDKLHENNKPKGYEYMFSEIPNTKFGESLVKNMRAYLNDETYTMRVKGQHLKKELYGQGRAYWGQSIEDSSHLRVYINKKNIKWKDIK